MTNALLHAVRNLVLPGALVSALSAPALVFPSQQGPAPEPAPSGDATEGIAWPRWRGPLGTGEADATPPVTWSEEENVAWKVPLPGHGKSTPIILNERIFLQAAIRAGEAPAEALAARELFEDQFTEAPEEIVAFLVLCLSAKDGEVVWETVVKEALPLAGVHETNGYASFSPVTDGERLYASFGSYGVYALDVDTGDVQWSFDMGPQRTRRGWGEAGSPALAGDALLVVADNEDDSHIHALDADSGEVRWTQPRDEPSTWTTPFVVEAGGALQAVVNGTTAVRSYDVATGEVLWHCGGQTVNAIPSIVSDGTWAIAMSGYRGAACKALSLTARGDLSAVEGAVAWSHDDGTPYVPSPVLTDGRVYFLGGNSGRLSCIDLATGALLLDRERLDLGNVYASPIAADGRLYVVGRDGSTVVLRHGDELETLAVNVLEDPIDASPVAVGDTLYLRSDSHLYAIRAE